MKKITVIPARSGSKGLIDKNILKIKNIPLFAWSILHAKYYSSDNDLIIVSSDSDNYLEIAKKYGAIPFKRDAKLSLDSTPTEPVMKNVTDNLSVNEDDLIVLLQPTSPIRKKDTIDRLFESFKDKNTDSALTLTKYHKFLWKDHDGYVTPKESTRPRRQDIKNLFYETGSIYATKYSKFVNSEKRVSGNTKGVFVDFDEVLEIDNEIEFKIISKFMESFNEWEQELINFQK